MKNSNCKRSTRRNVRHKIRNAYKRGQRNARGKNVGLVRMLWSIIY